MATESGDKRGRSSKLHPPFAQPDPGRRAEIVEESEPSADSWSVMDTPAAATSVDERPAVEDLPSIDDYLDELPSIDDFLDRPEQIEPSLASEQPFESESEVGWAAADWQSYDWRAAGALGKRPPEATEAHAEWSNTDWGGPSSGYQEGDRGPLEIAAALDILAHRIRTGEISLERFRGTPPEAALAAAFAALLRNRA